MEVDVIGMGAQHEGASESSDYLEHATISIINNKVKIPQIKAIKIGIQLRKPIV